jgi:parvulin-like peptidyl-prolyl isomerase
LELFFTISIEKRITNTKKPTMTAMARHILVKNKEDAEKLKQRLSKGEAFDVLAKKTFDL